MKFTKHFAALALVPLALLSSCNESMFSGYEPTETGTGTILPSVTYDATVKGAPGTRAVTEYTDITVNDLTLTLTNIDKGVTNTYAYSDFPTNKGFAIGKYNLTASYGNPEEEGFEKPSVYGEADFTVSEGKATQVSLTATPSKTMVGVEFDESALGYFTELGATLHSTKGQNIDYATNETRYAYLKPGWVTLDVTFTKPNGKGATMKVASFEALAQHRYKVQVRLGKDDEKTPGAGGVDAITIKYDETLEMEDVTVDISDEVLNAPAPEITLTGVKPGETLSMLVASSLNDDIRFDIKSLAGIKSAVLTTTGNKSGLPAGWPESVDLVSADANLQQTLTSLGFKNIGVFGKTGTLAHLASFELTSLIEEHMPATAQNADPVTFSLVVTDNNNKVSSEKVSFSVKKDDIYLTLETIEDEVYNGQETVNVLAHFNGTGLDSILKVEYLRTNGFYHSTDVAGVQAKTGENESYIVSVKVPDDAHLPVSLKATVANHTTELEILNGTAPTVSVNNNDVFAKYAWATVNSAVSRDASVEYSTNGTSYNQATATKDGSDYRVTGLTPGTTYYLRAKIGALVSEPVSFTTETEAQIPGGDMESWGAEKTLTKTATTWHYYDPVDPWYGSNETSFSKAAATTFRSATSAVGYSTDKNTGTYSAYVRTTGSGSTSLQTKANNGVFAGELTLGSGNSGNSLTSRPTSVSFWYKYSAYTNGDKGLAEIKLIDENNNELGSFTIELEPTASFVRVYKTFKYGRNSAKAKTIKVRFRSTATNNYLTKDNVNTISDTHMLSAGSESEAFIGSVLLVDDIELVY